jgi:hypothetical protein
MTRLFAYATLAILPLLAACESIPQQPYFQEHCTDRAFDAGFCEQDTNLRLFTPYGPIREGR